MPVTPSRIALRTLFVSAVLLVLILRIYAACCTVAIRTWDDAQYRQRALDASASTSTGAAIAAVLLPNPHNLEGQRSIGYHSWLVLADHTLGLKNKELQWQILNSLMLIIQGVLLFWLVLRCTGSWDLCWGILLLYLMTPFIFGINRWVMTENHVHMGVIVLICATFWLLAYLDRAPRTWLQAMCAALPVAFLFGMFNTMREYTLPSYALLLGTVLLGLLVHRQFAALLVFAVFEFFYLRAMVTALSPVIQAALTKSGAAGVDKTQNPWWHPLPDLLQHGFWHVYGPAVTVLLLLAVCGVLAMACAQLVRVLRRHRFLHLLSRSRGELLCFAGYLVALLVNSFLVVWSAIRVGRVLYLPYFFLLAVALIGHRMFVSRRRRPRIEPWLLAALAMGSVVTAARFSYELFFAFDAGKSYEYPATALERVNHPMHLRPLRNSEDMHIVGSTAIGGGTGIIQQFLNRQIEWHKVPHGGEYLLVSPLVFHGEILLIPPRNQAQKSWMICSHPTAASQPSRWTLENTGSVPLRMRIRYAAAQHPDSNSVIVLTSPSKVERVLQVSPRETELIVDLEPGVTEVEHRPTGWNMEFAFLWIDLP